MGKLAFFLVLGFSTIFLVMGHNANSVSSRSVENMLDYHAKTVAHNIAISGANLAANEIFLNSNWKTGYSSVAYEDGYLDANVVVLDPFLNIRKLTTTGTYRGVTKNVEVILKPSNFSKFAYYSEDEGSIHWHDGDTVWGPWHSQDDITVSQSPVFFGKVTTKKGLKYKNPPYTPEFQGGIETGVDVPFPSTAISDLQNLATTDGFYFDGSGYELVELQFDADSIKYRIWNNKSDYKYPPVGPDTAQWNSHLASDFAPNGVIYLNNQQLRIRGTVKGQYTVASNSDMYIDDDIVYNTDPRIDPTSTDLFGIVCKEKIYIADNDPNNNNIELHASIFSQDKGFGAENPGGRPNSGELRLLGGMQQHKRELVSNPWPTHGFSKRYRYDERLMFASPPGYPGTGNLEIVSRFE